jgi:hypothetical protein
MVAGRIAFIVPEHEYRVIYMIYRLTSQGPGFVSEFGQWILRLWAYSRSLVISLLNG